MRISLPFVVALLLSLDTFAAPVPNPQAGDELTLEVRKAVAKPVAKKPVAKPVVKKPVAKPVAKPAAKKPVAKPAAKPAAKPIAKPAAKSAAKPVAKPVAAKKPADVNKPVAAPVKKPAAAPAKKPTTVAPAKKPTTAAPAKKPAAPAKKPATKPPALSAVKPAASAQPSACTLAQVKARELEELEERELQELEARLGSKVTHPSGGGTVSLFHGTTAANAAALAAGVDLSKTRGTGDFNHKPEVPGGFYLTDSVVAAAQFACYGIPGKSPTSTDVVEFKWTGAGQKVFTFPGETADWLAFQQFNANANIDKPATGPFAAKAAELFQNDMIVGPLNGPSDTKLTDSFQQYAVIKQAAATNNLQLKTVHKNILCKNVPVGNKLSATQYNQGQATNAKFSTLVASLQKPKSKIGGSCVIQ